MSAATTLWNKASRLCGPRAATRRGGICLEACVLTATAALLASSASAELVLYSPLDNDTISGLTAQDIAGTPENGLLRDDGTVTTGVTGQIGEAIDAEVTGSAASVAYGDVHDVGSGSQTIMLWYNGTSVPSKDQYLARKGNTASGDIGWSIFLDDIFNLTGVDQYRVSFRVNAVGGYTNEARAVSLFVVPAEETINTWHHVAFVMDTVNGTLTGYVDGTNTGETTNPWGLSFTPGNMNTTSQILLGAGTTAGTSTLIDDFAVFDEALTAQQIQDIYNDGLNHVGLDAFLPQDLPGDLNGDGYVGLDDLQPILDYWNQNVPPADPIADISGPDGVPDGYIGLDDLQPVLDNWNAGTPPTPSAAVPEPATGGLLLAGLALLQRRGKRD